MINKTPYSILTHSNPWLLNINEKDAIIGPEGISLTASYIWSKEGKEREDLVNWVFKYYRKKGFPKILLTDVELKKEFNKLRVKKVCDLLKNDKEISNSSSLCNNVYKNFVWEKYYSAKGEKKSKSVIDVFNNDEKLLNVIKNRMGYCLTREDGEERPYIFTITDRMILQGIRSTGYGYNVSLFKPIIAKYLYKHYARKRVFDYSGGWGARCLAAMSLDLEYYGVDPYTFKEINEMMMFFKGEGRVIKGVSEDRDIYKDIPEVDCIMSSPPYFNLERYNDSEDQSYNKFKEYNDWIGIYWKDTVNNCLTILKDGGYFILIVKEALKKHKLSQDMKGICIDSGLKIEKVLYTVTSRSHLSGKKKSKKVLKNNELIYIFKKNKI